VIRPLRELFRGAAGEIRSASMTTIGQVFVPGGLPGVTYVPRDGLKLETLFGDYLDERGRILSLSGPTKSGKTVLIRRMLPQSIELSGGDIKSAGDFWAGVVDHLKAYPEETKSIERGDAQTDTLEGNAGVSVPTLFDLGGSVSRAKEDTQSRAHTVARIRPDHLIAKEKLNAAPDTVVVIDDFHYMPPAAQLDIVRGLKPLVFDGTRVVIASVPHRAFDAVRVEKEMTGRVEQLPIPTWERPELEAIALRGFGELNVSSEQADVDRLVQESFRSPHLMQDFCLQFGKLNGVRQTQEERLTLAAPADWSAFFRGRAPSASKAAFDLLVKGPPRTDRIPRILKDGTQTDIYGAVLAAIASTGPVTELPYDQLRAALRDVLEGEPPQLHEVTRVLLAMSKIAREQIEGEPVVDYDEDYKTLHISDPFFAFYLRWGIGVAPAPLT
jgi:hypothetical protein